jgi:flagellar basal-body rod protein FlgB
MSLIDPTQLALEAAMRGSEMRQTLLTNNLANASTPGYQPRDVNFQSALSNAMQSGQSPESVSFTPFAEAGIDSPDGNGVNADQQSAQLAQNGLLYQALTEIAGAREGILESAMGTK